MVWKMEVALELGIQLGNVGEMRPSGFCGLRVWGQLWCSVPMTHIPEKPLGSFPMPGRAQGGPDLDPSPCLAACPSLHAGTQGAAWGCASVYPPIFLDTQDLWSWGGTVLLTEADVGSLGTAPCAGVMPRPQRLACLRLYCPALSWLFQPCLCCLPCPSPWGWQLTVPCVCFAW